MTGRGTGEATSEFATQEQRDERVLVIMNAEGEPLSSGGRFPRKEVPSVTYVAVELLATGVVATAVAVALVVSPIRRARAATRADRR